MFWIMRRIGQDWARLGDGRKANLGRLYQWSGYFQWTRSFAILADQAPRRSNGITMRNTKLAFVSAILLIAVFSGLGLVLDPNNRVERAVGVGITGIEAVVAGRESAKRQFKAPNDVHIQYYRWDCVENCVQPEFQWTWQVKEKYQLTSFLKVYAGFTPDHDAAQVSIKIKSPVPMVVAMLPSDIAIQLHAKPELFETALEKNPCQQRGIQSMEFH